MFLNDTMHYDVLPNFDTGHILDQWEWDYDTKGWDPESIAKFEGGDSHR